MDSGSFNFCKRDCAGNRRVKEGNPTRCEEDAVSKLSTLVLSMHSAASSGRAYLAFLRDAVLSHTKCRATPLHVAGLEPRWTIYKYPQSRPGHGLRSALVLDQKYAGFS